MAKKLKWIVVQTGPELWAVAYQVGAVELDRYLVVLNRIPSGNKAIAIKRALEGGTRVDALPAEWLKYKVKWL